MKTMLRKVRDGDKTYTALMFCCPGCAENGGSGLHMLPISEPGNPVWTFDGNLEAPTLNPSILTKMNNEFVCHSYLRSGIFDFLDDCTHSFKSKHVPMPDLPEWVTKEQP